MIAPITLLLTLSVQVGHAQDSWKPGDAEPTQAPQPDPEPIETRNAWKEASGTLSGGTTLLLVGGITGATTYAIGTSNPDAFYHVDAGALELTNVVGWTMMGCGIGLLGVGITHGITAKPKSARVAAGPGGIKLAGRF